MQRLLTSAETAELLGVSPSTVKRWADEGLLACAKTVGSHRRFERSVVEAFRASQQRHEPGAASGSPLGPWLDDLLGAATSHPLEARLLGARARLGSWWAVCDELAPTIAQIGVEWVEGRLSILEEHQASERLARTLQRITEWLPAGTPERAALLATAEGDDHTLGLSCVELVLRELGWSVRWVGRKTPLDELVRDLTGGERPVRLVAISASAASAKARPLAAAAEALAQVCKPLGTALVLGGAGAWPDAPAYGVRLRDFRGLHEYVRWLPA